MRTLLLTALALLLASCSGGQFAPTLPPLHHFERENEVQAAVGFSPGETGTSLHASLAWNPVHHTGSLATAEGVAANDRGDSTGRDGSSLQLTDGIAVALAAAHGIVSLEEGGRETFELGGDVSMYTRLGGLRYDIFGGVAFGTYHATYYRVIALDPTRPWISRRETTPVTFNYLRPSVGAAFGATSITGPSQSGIAGGVYARLALPVIIRSTLEDAARTMLIPEAGGWIHFSPGQAAQIEVQWGGVIPVDICHGCDPDTLEVAHDLWDTFYGLLGFRVRIAELF